MLQNPVGWLTAFLLLTTALSYPLKPSVAKPIPASIRRTLSCLPGFELVGKQCIATEVFEAKLVCPHSTVPLEGDCVSFTEAIRVCPEGYAVAGDRCVSNQVILASPICDEGLVDGDYCRLVKEASPVCRNGFHIENDKCVQYTPRQVVCSDGYQLQGKSCLKSLKISAAPVCPVGFSLVENGTCTNSVPVPPGCNDGFKLIGTECLKEVSKVSADCPLGFEAVDDSCYVQRTFPVRLECPDGFTLGSINQCVKEVQVPPTCPSGFSRGLGSRCERLILKKPICAKTEEHSGRQCRSFSKSMPELVCPDDYELVNDQCKKVQVEEPRFRCAAGVLNSDRCTTVVSTSPRLKCPAGFEIDKSVRCVRDVAYRCMKEVESSECEMPPVVKNQSQQLRADYKTKSAPAFHDKFAMDKVEAVVQSPTVKCSPVKRLTAQTCTKNESVPVLHVCSDGSAPTGKSCDVFSTSPAEVYCDYGILDKGRGSCVAVDLQPSNKVCPTGRLQLDGSCLHVHKRAAALVCPEGLPLEGDHCVISVPEVVHENQVIRQPPREICDLGIRKDADCVEVEKVVRNRVCPSGSEDRFGFCVVTDALIISNPTVVKKPAEYVCPNGSTANGESCFSTEVDQPHYICPAGTVEKESRCFYSTDLVFPPAKVLKSSLRFVCPAGYSQQGNKCSTTANAPFNLQCPSGYRSFLNDKGQECVRSHPRISRCSAGTEEVGKNCIKKRYAPPQVTEIKTCTKGQPGC